MNEHTVCIWDPFVRVFHWSLVARFAIAWLSALRGWMYTLDTFRGEAWLENVHKFMATLILFMVIAPIAGVLYASHEHRENLVKFMFDGKKRCAEPGDFS